MNIEEKILVLDKLKLEFEKTPQFEKPKNYFEFNRFFVNMYDWVYREFHRRYESPKSEETTSLRT